MRVAVAVLMTALALAAWQGPAWSQVRGTDQPILFSADEVVHDRQNGTITANGHVEFTQDDRILLADRVTYNQRDDRLIATGNISLLEPTGEVMFAEYVELSGDMKDGIVEDIRILLSDSSRIAATGARRSGGVVTEMRNAVYSPCKPCAERKDNDPLWQVKALRIKHDQIEHTIEYQDAWIEFAGVPIAYTPYFSHADPTIKRKTGFLPPRLGGSSYLGSFLSFPYYVTLAPNRDLTITPTITTKQNVILDGEFRELQPNGEFNLTGSATFDADNKFRGHIRGDARFDIDDTWRWGLDLYRATDDTYLRTYRIDSPASLVSRAFTEGFRKRNYMALNAYTFQNLRENTTAESSPIVAPVFDFNHVGEPDALGGRTSLDINVAAFTRREGTDTQRISVGGQWRLPFTSPLGDIYAITASLRGDLYHVNDLNPPPNSTEPRIDGFSGRIWPQLSVDWRYPWARQDGNVNQIIEPIASLVVGPNGGNPKGIPNEDSIEFEFDENNLFDLTRFTGLDRVDGGPRVNYGVKWSLFGRKGSTTVFFGQSYRIRADEKTYDSGSGLEGSLSDIVGSVRINPSEYLSLNYKTRLDKDNFVARRNEFQFSAGPPAFRVSTNYVFFDNRADSEFPSREEISYGVNTVINRNWRTSFSGLHDLGDDGGLRSVGLSLTYEDECFIFDLTASRRFFSDRDLKPDDRILLQFTFKTLGEVKAGIL